MQPVTCAGKEVRGVYISSHWLENTTFGNLILKPSYEENIDLSKINLAFWIRFEKKNTLSGRGIERLLRRLYDLFIICYSRIWVMSLSRWTFPGPPLRLWHWLNKIDGFAHFRTIPMDRRTTREEERKKNWCRISLEIFRTEMRQTFSGIKLSYFSAKNNNFFTFVFQ